MPKTLQALFCLATLLFFAFHTIAQVNLTSGLQGHWHLNGHAFDSSGNNLSGFLSGGATGIEDRFGRAFGAVGFNGISAQVSIPIDLNRVSGAFTLSLWFKTNRGTLQSLVGRHQFGFINPAEDFMLYLQTGNRGLESLIFPGGSNCTDDRLPVVNHLVANQPICSNRWYFVAWVYDGSVQSIYIDGKLVESRTVPFATVSACANSLLLGASHQSIPRFFSGAMDDLRLYNRAINMAEVKALYTENSTSLYDFSYLPDNCNPLDVRFVYNGPGNNISWRFNNIATRTGRNANYLFAKEGEYPVDLIVEYDNCFTKDTLSKNVALIFDYRDIILNQDTTLCAGTSFQLATGISSGVCWQPHPFLTLSGQGNATVAPQRDTVFVATTVSYGANRVVNGDFSAGNSGFFTNYNFASVNTTEGQYFVSPFPRNWNGAVSQCTQPNGQAGNMLLVNGDPVPNKIVWQQDIDVVPNNSYAFGLDIAALFPVNAAILQFAINGVVVGDSITANITPCSWRNFFTIWNSGTATRARISIVNRNIEVQGNDFALDNITFREIRYEVDTFRVRVDSPELDITKDTAVCQNTSLQLEVKNAANVVWSPSTGLNNPSATNPIAQVAQTITYTATANTSAGCNAQGSVTLTALALPEGSVSPAFVNLCKPDSVEVTATGGTSYLWTGQGFANPTAATTRAFVTTTNPLRVTITGSNQCSITDSIAVTFLPPGQYALTPSNPAVCQGDSLVLEATGGSSYKWQLAGQVIDTSSGKLTVFPGTSQTLFVTITNEACNDTITLSTPVVVNALPATSVSSSNDFDCYTNQSQLLATGGIAYTWQAGSGLSAVDIPNPIATAAEADTYHVRVTDSNGCSKTDSIVVGFVNNAALTISGGGTFCANIPVPLQVSGGTTYQWTPLAGINNPVIPNPTVSVGASTTFRVAAITSNGCRVEDSIRVAIFPAGNGRIITENPTVCGNNSVQLEATGGVWYSWQPSGLLSNDTASNPLATLNANTRFTVQITDSNACAKTDSILVMWQPTPDFDLQLSKNTLCQGDTLTVTATGGNRFQWSAGSQPIPIFGPSTFSYVPAATGVVGVRITNDACRDSAFVEKTITVHLPPVITIEKSGDWDCSSDMVQLTASGAATYTWLPGPGISNAAIANPFVRHTATTTYQVRGVSVQGCSSLAQVEVSFLNSGNLNSFLMPTAFTPNGDGLNDCFGITRAASTVSLQAFEIYNRYGQVVFQGNDTRKCWDGMVKGQPQPTGNYMYRLKATTACGDIDQKGSFMLIR